MSSNYTAIPTMTENMILALISTQISNEMRNEASCLNGLAQADFLAEDATDAQSRKLVPPDVSKIGSINE